MKIISWKELIKILVWLWAIVKPGKSSHFKVKFNWKCSVIPVHWNRDLPKWLLLAILKQLDIDTIEFLNYH